jgi:hypothetical protein
MMENSENNTGLTLENGRFDKSLWEKNFTIIEIQPEFLNYLTGIGNMFLNNMTGGNPYACKNLIQTANFDILPEKKYAIFLLEQLHILINKKNQMMAEGDLKNEMMIVSNNIQDKILKLFQQDLVKINMAQSEKQQILTEINNPATKRYETDRMR